MTGEEQRSPAAVLGDAIRERAAQQQRLRFERIFGAPVETPADDDADVGDGGDEAGDGGTS